MTSLVLAAVLLSSTAPTDNIILIPSLSSLAQLDDGETSTPKYNNFAREKACSNTADKVLGFLSGLGTVLTGIITISIIATSKPNSPGVGVAAGFGGATLLTGGLTYYFLSSASHSAAICYGEI